MIVAIDLMNTSAANHLTYLTENFFSARQQQNEFANVFACRLRRLASDCAFGDNKTTLLRDIRDLYFKRSSGRETTSGRRI